MQELEPEASNPPTIDVRWPRAGVAHVILGGEHDLDSADRLSAVLTQMLEGGSHLIVDLGATRFIDSSTIQVLLATKGRADAEQAPLQPPSRHGADRRARPRNNRGAHRPQPGTHP